MLTTRDFVTNGGKLGGSGMMDGVRDGVWDEAQEGQGLSELLQ
jgi:hypothetical protein